MTHILALDQGTTSSRAILFARQPDGALAPVASAQEEIAQIFPAPGQVEHDPEELWSTTLATARAAIAKAGVAPGAIAAIGITNQRETTILWDRATGRPLHNALVWQDRRTAGICADLREAGLEPLVTARTGLILDPYFSGTKLKWLLDTLPGARDRARRGELAFGTVDCWLVWNLTGGALHATDATNAARTMLYDIGRGAWDDALCAHLDIPMELLPRVLDSAGDYGTTPPGLFGAGIAIRGVAGDQQAAALGQACFAPGMVKSTYGTGCFALLNTGETMVTSENRLLTTIASRIGGRVRYALEGSIFVAGAAVQWQRDGLGILTTAAQSQALAEAADPAQRVTLVPAFTGLGAPWWRPECRGAIFGLTRNSGPAEFARAALESVGFQTHDLLEAMHADWPGARGPGDGVLRVDGGMANSDWTMQFLADILDAPVDRPEVTETTALGAGYLAALGAGLTDEAAFAGGWRLERRFTPGADPARRRADLARWRRALSATMAFHAEDP
ncbi:glycerol kinase GlpK [Pseudogemmobacter sonorensis]|uniref:glycerol kinase GlpK n=1 Tax=Pseudogemmobacter sonorensis TaxID=2989681 RepID=UPI0036BE919E